MAEPDAQPRCTACKKDTVFRLRLRNCSHVICIGCGIAYLKIWIKDCEKARIKCPKKECPERIHENDLRLLLHEDNGQLDLHMPKSQRQWLLHHHDKHVIAYALGGRGRYRQCPLCKNMYGEAPGCRFVRCPNLRCRTRFCFECGDPINSWRHFSKGTCRVSWDDLWKLSYVFRFLITTNPIFLVFLAPIVYVLLLIIAPFSVAFALPFLVLRQEYRKMKRHPNKMEKTLFAFKVIFAGPALLLCGLLLAAGALWTVVPLWVLYLLVIVLQCLPQTRTAFKVLDYGCMIAGCFGLDDWRTLIKDSKQARQQMLIDREQAEAEQNEEVHPVVVQAA